MESIQWKSFEKRDSNKNIPPSIKIVYIFNDGCDVVHRNHPENERSRISTLNFITAIRKYEGDGERVCVQFHHNSKTNSFSSEC